MLRLLPETHYAGKEKQNTTYGHDFSHTSQQNAAITARAAPHTWPAAQRYCSAIPGSPAVCSSASQSTPSLSTCRKGRMQAGLSYEWDTGRDRRANACPGDNVGCYLGNRLRAGDQQQMCWYFALVFPKAASPLC